MTAPAATRSRRGALVLAVGIAAYFVAVVHRTALGVAGVEAIDRFGLSATGLATFSVVQLVVYAGMQLPAGRLLDRFGPRAVITAGSAVMAAGQLVLALADEVPAALVARVLIGAGDAGIFISVVRIIPEWFEARRIPVLLQTVGLVGQTGQLASAVPVAWLLHTTGWGPTFGTLAAVGALTTVAALVGISRPATAASSPGAAARETFRQAVRLTVTAPGTRLGFWSHFVTPFGANVVALLWGVPFFVQGQGRTPAEASLLLTVLTVTIMATSPFVGLYTARHPMRRSWAVLATCATSLVAWVALLVPSTPRPLWQLVLFVAVIGVGGPISLVGMDFARSFAPAARLGTATGFVNMGGFISTVVAVLAVGLVLQAASPPGAGTYTLDAYRAAFAVLLVPWLVGVVGVLTSRRRVRADLEAAGTPVLPLRQALAVRRAARAGRPDDPSAGPR